MILNFKYLNKMLENRKPFVRDYKERFEFKLTVGENIICQRYFKINNFNEQSVRSFELVDTVRKVVDTIDKELKSKTLDYLEIFSPMYFNSVSEMNKYFENPVNRNRMKLGEGIVVKGEKFDYCWGDKDAPKQLSFKFDDGELYNGISDNSSVTYKFAFLVDGREVCAATWDGIYPKFIRNAIDLSNKRGKIDYEDLSRLGFEEYLNYRVCMNRSDLVYTIIKEICSVCCLQGNNVYTTISKYGDKSYKNHFSFNDVCKLYNLSWDGMTRHKSRQEIETFGN